MTYEEWLGKVGELHRAKARLPGSVDEAKRYYRKELQKAGRL